MNIYSHMSHEIQEVRFTKSMNKERLLVHLQLSATDWRIPSRHHLLSWWPNRSENVSASEPPPPYCPPAAQNLVTMEISRWIQVYMMQLFYTTPILLYIYKALKFVYKWFDNKTEIIRLCTPNIEFLRKFNEEQDYKEEISAYNMYRIGKIFLILLDLSIRFSTKLLVY